MQEIDAFDKFRDSFNQTNAHFHVLEQRVSVDLQMEYFKYSQQLRKTFTGLTDADYESYVENLPDPTVGLDKKKLMLSSLAISRQIKAYRFLEDYVRNADEDVRDWAAMALMESRISLESELSDERQVYISTGLGGKGEKLRFCVLLIANELKVFADYQKEVIQREFPFALEEAACDIERLTIKDQYAELVVLIPMRSDVKSILDRVINECNQYGNFLSTVYTITNVKELSEEDIDLVIKKYEKNLQTGS